ncbi:MAG: DUF7347 domain-containing protein [Actinomycetaceae bacterium]
MTSDDADLRARLLALEERVSTLEHARDRTDSPEPQPGAQDEETFWALHGLRARLPDHPDTAGGAVMLVGSLTLPGGGPVEWQQAGGSDGLVESDWTGRADVFAALGHPVRLELLRRLLSGVTSTAELAGTEGLGTSGQLHHHLRQLVAAGWVRQAGRGRYRVPAARVVPLLAMLVGAER